MNADVRGMISFLLRRAFPAALAMAIGVGVLLGAGDAVSMLLGFLFFLVAALFVAGPIARRLAEPAGNLLWPRTFDAKPQPMYGIPQSRRAKGQFEEAIAAYARIAADFPGEIRPHVEMIDIALADLHDPARAEAIYLHGAAVLENPDDRELLAQAYEALRARQVPPSPRRLEWHPHP